MKVVLSALAGMLAVTAAFGQGQFVFNNRIPPDINARFLAPGDPSDGRASSIANDSGFFLALYGGPAGTPVNQMLPLDPASTSFRGAAGTAGAGYVVPVTVTVPGVALGQRADGELVLIASGICTSYGPYTVTLGGGIITPPNLPMGTSPLVIPSGLGESSCPEPSPTVLGAIGIGAIFLCLRRKRSSGLFF